MFLGNKKCRIYAACGASQTPISLSNMWGGDVWVYEGAEEFYAGDLVKLYTSSESNYLTGKSGVTYTSSKPSVAKVDKKTGKITPKKKGTTTITIKYKGASTKLKLKVTSKSAIKKMFSSDYLKRVSEHITGAEKFLQKTGAKQPVITNANRYKLLTAYLSYDGRTWQGWSIETDENEKSIRVIVSSEALRAHVICESIKEYAKARNPFGYAESNCNFCVKSMSGKSGSKTIKLKLEQKVTADQIFGAYYHYSWDTDIQETKTHAFPVTVQNQKTRYQYYAVASITKDSDIITIKLDNYKLEKNVKYRLVHGRYSVYWNDVFDGSFKAK